MAILRLRDEIRALITKGLRKSPEIIVVTLKAIVQLQLKTFTATVSALAKRDGDIRL